MSGADRARTLRTLERLRRHEMEAEAAGMGGLAAQIATARRDRVDLVERMGERGDPGSVEGALTVAAFVRSIGAEIRATDARIARFEADYDARRGRLVDRFAEVKSMGLLAERAEAAALVEAERTEARNAVPRRPGRIGRR